MTSRTRIALLGATGRTGSAVARGLVGHPTVDLVACVAPSAPARAAELFVPPTTACASLADLGGLEIDVLVDLSVADAVPGHLQHALESGQHVVLGVTGLDPRLLAEFGERFAQRGLGLLYVPNFSIGAVLMMRFAAEAARLLPDVEIVETHHHTKRDAPSGTARRTAELVAAARGGGPAVPLDPAGSGARGEYVEGVRVHSLRLQGAVAHQQVVFGAPGELLTIAHDAIDRSCYAAGVALAVGAVSSMTGLTTGLENVS